MVHYLILICHKGSPFVGGGFGSVSRRKKKAARRGRQKENLPFCDAPSVISENYHHHAVPHSKTSPFETAKGKPSYVTIPPNERKSNATNAIRY
jgi:hypothetical protein